MSNKKPPKLFQLKDLDQYRRTVLDTLVDGLVVIDEKGIVLNTNKACAEMFGYSVEEIIGNSVNMLMTKNDHDHYNNFLEQRLKAGTAKITGKGLREITGKKKDGARIDLEIAVGSHEEDGKTIFVASLRDVTKRKEAEAENIRLGNILEDSLNEIYVLSPKTLEFNYVNKQGRKNLGYSMKELKNMTPADVGASRSLEEIKEIFSSLENKREKKLRLEGRHQRKDGSFYDIELRVWLSEAGESPVYVAIVDDITDKKAAGAALLELQEKLRLITENATDIISLRDASGKMVYLSPSFQRQLKYDPEEYMAQAAWKSVMHPDDRETFMKEWKKTVFEKGLPFASEHRLITAEGDYLWFDSQSRPVKNEAGEVIACVSISRNISQQRKMQEQLRQAKKMEAVGQLTGGVAHEFNNILTTILGSLRIFETLEMDEDTRECLNHTIEASKRGAALTGHLLKFSRKEKMEPEILNPNDLFRDINPLLEITLGKNIAYKFQPARENIHIHVDRHELEDALLDLCNNAREATEQAGGSVKVETSHAEITKGPKVSNSVPPGKYCVITVSDTGAGMSEDVLENALDPFFTTKAVGKGAGLGLSSVYGFIQQSKGHLIIDSKPGLGTSVHMYFPLVKVKPKTKPVKTSGRQKEKASPAMILFVDSDEKQTLLATKALRPLAGTVLTARTLVEAGKIIKSQPDISLLITQMTINGEETGQELVRKFTSKFKKGGILLVAGHPDKAQALIKKSSLIGNVLTSPYSLSSLIIKTDNLLKTLTI